MPSLTADQLPLVAQRFKALSEPARLSLLNRLREGEQTVTQLTQATGLSQANTSRHLKSLLETGFVRRTRDGHHVKYWLADDQVLALCDIMCKRLQDEAGTVARRVGG